MSNPAIKILNMGYIFSFEKLNVWVDSKELIKSIYQITKNFPPDEKFGLTNQLRRASVSIASNLAEGSSRASIKDRLRFITIAYGSLMEVLNQLIIAHELCFVEKKEYGEVRGQVEKIANKINALRRSQLNS